MSISHPINRQPGFTLLELLIAITVFSIISTITYSGLKVVLDTEEQTRGHLERLAQLQIGMSLLQRDIEQAVEREIRDEFGDNQPAMYSGSFTGILLEFTRSGYPNPMDLQRSGLQRVGYLLEDETLYRISWPSLDRAQETEPGRSSLIDNIKAMELVFFDQQMKPHSEWPMANQDTDNNPQHPLPKAIELTLELEKMGNIRRLFRVAEGPIVNPDSGG